MTPEAPPPAAPRRSLGRQALSGVAWLSALNGLGGVGMLALAWWLNRSLPSAPVAMGQWSVVLSLLLMTSLAFDGGITSVIQQRKELPSGALSTLAWLQILLGIAGAGLLFVVALPVAGLMAADQDPDAMVRLVRLACPAVVVLALGFAPKALLQREMRFRAVASVEGGATLVTIVLAVLLVPRHGVTGLVLAVNGRHLVETVSYWLLAGVRPWALLRRPSWTEAKEPLGIAVSMGLQGILGTLVRQGDVLLVGALIGTVAAGVYRQIQQLVVQPYSKLTMYVARAAFPAIAKMQDDTDRLHRGVSRLQRLLAMAVLPLLLGLAAVSPRVLAEYLGSQYADRLGEAVPTMVLLCLGAAITSYVYSLVVALNAAGLSHEVLARQVAGSVAVLVLMAFGSPWGLVGVAAGRVAAAAFHGALVLPLTERRFRFGRESLALSIREAFPASAACCAVAAVAGLLLSRFWPESAPYAGESAFPMRAALLAQVAAGGIAYGLTMLAMKVDPRAEWRALRS